MHSMKETNGVSVISDSVQPYQAIDCSEPEDTSLDLDSILYTPTPATAYRDFIYGVL